MYRKGLSRLLRTVSVYGLTAILTLQPVTNAGVVVCAQTQDAYGQSVSVNEIAETEETVTDADEKQADLKENDAAESSNSEVEVVTEEVAAESVVDAAGFDIDEEGVLVAYTGTSDIIHIPDGVTKVATGALANIECKEVYLPVGLKEIEPSAIKLAMAAKIYFPSGWEKGLKTYNGYPTYSLYSFITPGNSVNGTSVYIPSDIVSLDDLSSGYRIFSPVTQVIIQSKDGTDSYKSTSWYKKLISYNYMSVVDEREFDENGFAVRDGVLLSYNGPGGDITIPDTVTSIRNEMFRGMDIFDSITVGDSVTELGKSCFSVLRNRLKKVAIGNGVTVIPRSCFSVDLNLSEVVLGDYVKEIDEDAFFSTRALIDFTLPETVELVEKWAFFGSAAIDSIDFKNVKTLGQLATYDEPVHLGKVDLSSAEELDMSCFILSNIDYLILGPKLKKIESCTFYGKVGYIQWPENGILETIEIDGFGKTPSAILNDNPLPDTVKKIGETAFGSSKPCNNFRVPLNLEMAGKDCVTLSKDARVQLPSGWKGTCSFAEDALAKASATDNDMTLVVSSEIENLEDYFLNTDIFKHYVVQIMPNESDEYKNSTWYQKLAAANIIPEVEVYAGALFEGKRVGDTNQFAFEYAIEAAAEKDQTITFTIPEGMSLVADTMSNDMAANMSTNNNTITVKVAAEKKGTIRFTLQQNKLLNEQNIFAVDSSCAQGQNMPAKVKGLYGDFECLAVGSDVYMNVTGVKGESVQVLLNETAYPVQINSLGEGYAKLPLKADKTTIQLSVAGLVLDKKEVVERTDNLGVEVQKLILQNQLQNRDDIEGRDITTSGQIVLCYPTYPFTFEIEASGLDKLIEGEKELVLVNDEIRLPIQKIGNKYYAQGFVGSPKKEIRIEYGNICLFKTSVRWIIDPSGYVYEALESNPIEGATATIYYSPYPSGQDAVKWDAAECGQKNDLLTDANGYYGWDVPEGYYRVVVSKDGYATEKSEWMPVPPPQLNVNFNLKNQKNPEIKMIALEEDHLNLYFDVYMKKASLTSLYGYNLTAGEKNIEITQAKPLGDYSDDYAKGVSLSFKEAIAKEDQDAEFSLKITDKASYADKYFDATTVNGIRMSKEVTKLQIDSGAVVGKDHMIELTATLLPKEAAAGKKVTVTTTNSKIAKVNSVSAVDKNGTVKIVLTGVMPGQTALNLEVEDSMIAESIPVVVPISKEVGKTVIEKLEVKNPPVEKNLDGSEVNDDENPKPEEPKPSADPKPSVEPKPEPSTPAKEAPKKGKTVTVKNAKYKVTNAKTNGKGTVTFTGASKKNVTTVTIPKTVKINGYTYKVTQVADNAFKGYNKLKKVTIGANVTKIGKNAFSGCKKLKTIKVSTSSLKSVGKNALKGVHANCKIQVPSKKVKAYTKLFKGKGQGKKVKVTK